MAGSLGGLNTFFSLLSVCLSVFLFLVLILVLVLVLVCFSLSIHPSINQIFQNPNHPPVRTYNPSIKSIPLSKPSRQTLKYLSRRRSSDGVRVPPPPPAAAAARGGAHAADDLLEGVPVRSAGWGREGGGVGWLGRFENG